MPTMAPIWFQSEIWFLGSLNRAAQPFFSRYVSKDRGGDIVYNGVYVSKEALAVIVLYIVLVVRFQN